MDDNDNMISSSTFSSNNSSSLSDEAIIKSDNDIYMHITNPIIIPPIPLSFSDSEPNIEIVMDYLQVPKMQKMFLISPPASPPIGWEHSVEQAPVVAHRDMHNLKSVLDAKTPKEYYNAVFGNVQEQDDMMAKVVAKLSLCIQQSNQRNDANKESITETKITDIIINGENMNIDEGDDFALRNNPRPALLIEFQEETESLPKILIEDTDEPQSYTHSLEKLPVSMEEAGLFGERHRKQLKLTKTRIPQTGRPPM